MKLHENKEEFAQAIQAASRSLGIREVFIEKDYWVCFVLKNLSLSKDFKSQVVFKGGTSLSKAHQAIHRFSEDVDLAVILNGRTGNQIKNLLRDIESSVARTPLKEITKAGITSKGSRFRKTVWEFDKTSQGDYGDASPDLLLEINSFATPSPFGIRSIQTYISDFLQQEGLKKEISDYALQPFEVNVLDTKRTFAEKVAGIIRASFEQPKDHSELKKKIRHIYDITMLLRDNKITEFISSGEFLKLFEQVKTDDLNISEEQAAYTKMNPLNTPIFKSTSDVLKELTATYEVQFMSLVYKTESAPQIKEVKAALETVKKEFQSPS